MIDATAVVDPSRHLTIAGSHAGAIRNSSPAIRSPEYDSRPSTKRLGRLPRWTHICLLLLVLTCFAASCSAQRNSGTERRRQQFQERHRSLLLNTRREISLLSDQCHEQGLAQAARDLTVVSLELTTPKENPVFPRLMQLPVNPRLPPEDQAWRNRLRTIREEKAQELYLLARSALRAGLPSLAYEIVQDVVRLDPDHRHARGVLGQQMFHDPERKDDPTYTGEWVSPFEASKRTGSSPEYNHPQFGWLPVEHIVRYEQDLRPWQGKWISVQREAEIRRDFRNAWEVRTEHFLVKTNTSLEEGVAISRKLEIYYDWLQKNFAAFFETPASLQEKFEEAQSRRRNSTTIRPMEVHYYASRGEYEERMRGKIPPNLVTNGLYWEPDRTCYLFRNPEVEDFSTVFHEATHQILDLASIDDRLAAARKRKLVLRQRTTERWELCEHANFWILEGIACYMESFDVKDGAAFVGRPDHIRFLGAQQRLLLDGFYIPLQTFSALGKDEFRQHPNHTQLYTQGSGVAHFLLHYKDGIYRDDFVTLLTAVYRPILNSDILKSPSLEAITGVPFAELDRQYREHLENLAASLQQSALLETKRE